MSYDLFFKLLFWVPYLIGAVMIAPAAASAWWDPKDRIPREKRFAWDLAGVAVCGVAVLLWPLTVFAGFAVVLFKFFSGRYR